MAKTVITRIKNKVDFLTNWQSSTSKLLDGEIALVRVPTGENYVDPVTGKSEPVVELLMKVGDGVHTFNETDSKGNPYLPWLSAKASDVYSWAKAASVSVATIENKEYLIFKDKDGTEITDTRIDLSKFAIATDVQTTTNNLDARITAVEGQLGLNGGTNDSVSVRLTNLEGSVQVITGSADTNGSIANTIKVAKAYTDEREVEIKSYADQAEADAKLYSDDKLAAAVSTLNAKDADQDTAIQANTTAIANEKTAREKADTAINNKLAGIDNTVVDAINTAKTDAATTAQSKVDELKTGDVKINTENIAKNAAAITAEETRAKGIESNFESRISTMEVFWSSADNSADVVDTLKEIQEYIKSDETGAVTMAGNIQSNTTAIEGLTTRLVTAETDTGSLKGRTTAIENTIAGYSGTDTIKKAIDSVSERAEKGIIDAAAASEKIDTKAAEITTAYETYTDQAETAAINAAKEYTDTEVVKLKAKDAELTTEAARLDGLIVDNTTAISNEETARKAADDEINTKFGAEYDKDNTVAGAIADAKRAGTDAQGVADINKSDIADLKSTYIRFVDTTVDNITTTKLYAGSAGAEEIIFDCGGAPQE